MIVILMKNNSTPIRVNHSEMRKGIAVARIECKTTDCIYCELMPMFLFKNVKKGLHQMPNLGKLHVAQSTKDRGSTIKK
jgi:hypothetical protein